MPGVGYAKEDEIGRRRICNEWRDGGRRICKVVAGFIGRQICKAVVVLGRGVERRGWLWLRGLGGRSRLDAVRYMFRGMSIYIRYERTDFSVVVKSRGKPPNPWRWEIYRAGRSSAVEQSSVFYPTMAAANKAGKEALTQLLKKLRIRAAE
jgi:hypothetical protein